MVAYVNALNSNGAQYRKKLSQAQIPWHIFSVTENNRLDRQVQEKFFIRR